MKMKILNADLITDIVGEPEGFPKYTTQLINLANQNAQPDGDYRGVKAFKGKWEAIGSKSRSS